MTQTYGGKPMLISLAALRRRHESFGQLGTRDFQIDRPTPVKIVIIPSPVKSQGENARDIRVGSVVRHGFVKSSYKNMIKLDYIRQVKPAAAAGTVSFKVASNPRRAPNFYRVHLPFFHRRHLGGGQG
jgi:hypothetical protein